MISKLDLHNPPPFEVLCKIVEENGNMQVKSASFLPFPQAHISLSLRILCKTVREVGHMRKRSVPFHLSLDAYPPTSAEALCKIVRAVDNMQTNFVPFLPFPHARILTSAPIAQNGIFRLTLI